MFTIAKNIFKFVALPILFSLFAHAEEQGENINTPTLQGENSMINPEKIALCREKLHKVTDRDDLIQQLYETAFEDDCVYEMSNEDLERIWGIPVKQHEYFSPPTQEEILNDPSIQLRDIDSPLGFYIVTSKDYIGLGLSRDAYNRGVGTLFPEGHFPEIFGDFSKFEMSAEMIEGKGLFTTKYASKPTDYIQNGYIYYKKNIFYSGNIIYIEIYPYGSALGINFARNVRIPYLK